MASSDEVLRHVIEKYRSLEKPDFHWVREEYERDPFAALRAALGSRFDVADVTDLNSDVSFAYDLKPIEGDGKWTLRLSMVGPYATLVRHQPRTPSETIVDGPADARSPFESLVLEACASAEYELLSRDVLRLPVKLRLFETSPERVRVYQALFSDVDFLPGEYGETR